MWFEGAAAGLRAVRRSGEPWTFGMYPDMVPDYLEQRGLRLLADLGADEYRQEDYRPNRPSDPRLWLLPRCSRRNPRSDPSDEKKESSGVTAAEHRTGLLQGATPFSFGYRASEDPDGRLVGWTLPRRFRPAVFAAPAPRRRESPQK